MRVFSFTLSFTLAGLLLCGSAGAGQLQGGTYVGERFGRIEITPAPGRWEMIDREAAGGNDLGGPVVDLHLRDNPGGSRAVVHVTGVKKADPSITAEFVLATSRDALVQQGGTPEPVRRLAIGGRGAWTYEAAVAAQGRPARTRLVVVEGPAAIFLLQMVVPVDGFEAAGRAFEQLLSGVKY